MTIRRMIIISTFAALLAIATYITIPIPTVSFTLQTLMVVLIGFLLKPLDAFLAVLVYILVGLTGIPVFSNFKGGYEVLLGPTGGFIFSFLVSATGLSLMKSLDKNWIVDIPIMLFFGFVITYIIGIPVFIINTGNTLESSLVFFTPYFLWDIAKLALAYTIYLMIPNEVLDRIYPETV